MKTFSFKAGHADSRPEKRVSTFYFCCYSFLLFGVSIHSEGGGQTPYLFVIYTNIDHGMWSIRCTPIGVPTLKKYKGSNVWSGKKLRKLELG